MKINKILLWLMIIISILLCIPSIIYLINNRTVDGFNYYFTYNLQRNENENIRIMQGKIVIGLLIIFSIIYLIIIKKQKELFKSTKQMIFFVIIISLLFTLILPFLSSDIYYYIGDSWITSKYKENLYYTTVNDLQDNGLNDEILRNTGTWDKTTSVYGPLWNYIAIFLVSFSFGNITIALFIFKIAALIIHIANTYLIYKITKSKKYVLLYGLNPLVLLQFLSNVHNDIYLLFFILLALYFLIKKKNVLLTIIFLALSISIKFSSALIVPFILIYIFRKEKIWKKIIYCFIDGLSIIGIVILLYLPYCRDLSIFSNMLVQGTKYSQSIWIYIFLNTPYDFAKSINEIAIPIFLIFYLMRIVITLFNPKLTIKHVIKESNYIMLIFIFLILTNFQPWYILWVFPTIIWQNKYMRKYIIYLTASAIIPYFNYFEIESDLYSAGTTYSLKVIGIATICLIINIIIEKIIYKYKNRRMKKCLD